MQCICFLSFTPLTVCTTYMSLTSDRLSEVLQSILPVFDIYSLRSEQEMALMHSWLWKNVFIDLPTGSEKSIIYQLAPLVSSRLENLSPNSGLGKSDAIHAVVSPLISLMFFARMFPLDWIAILKFCFIPFNFSRQLWCFKISPWHIDLKTKWASFVGRSIPILRTSISIFRFTFPFPEHSPIQRGDILLHR